MLQPNHFHYNVELSPSFLDNNFEFLDAPVLDNMNLEFLFDECSFPIFDPEELDIIWNEENGSCSRHSSEGNEYFSSLSPSVISGDALIDNQLPLTIPKEGKELENRIGLNHLAMAYAEAVGMKQTELAEVIAQRINDKVSVVGEIKERVLYYALSQFSDYLKQESIKNFDTAFQAFYQIFPFGMVPHFTANSAILGSVPLDVEILHVIDFDIGEGAQWSSLIMAISQQPQNKITLRLTTIKWREEDSIYVPSWRKFEATKRRLQDYASSLGIMLIMEEIELQDLGREMKRRRKRLGRKEWLAFNCMWALPHMGRRRSRGQVMEFLAVAKEFNGVMTFSDGGERLNYDNYNGFGSFFENYLQHYQTLLESIEWNLPVRLAEARLSMECLFVAPYASCHTMKQSWEESKEGNGWLIERGFGFEGLSLRNESLIEAKEMVREGMTPFGIKIEGENGNEMVLEWKGIALVRVSAWRL